MEQLSTLPHPMFTSSNVYLIPSFYVYQMRAEGGRPYYEYIVQSHLASDSDYDNFSIHQYRPRRNNNQQNVRKTYKTAIFNIITLAMDCIKKLYIHVLYHFSHA